MKKGGGNWVDGDKFFNREQELRALEERVRDGTHTLLTAQRRMGKTSLVRELQRRLQNTGEFETVFVDLEAARDTADAIAEIAVRSKSVCGAWDLMKKDFTNFFRGFGDRIEELSISDLKVNSAPGLMPETGNKEVTTYSLPLQQVTARLSSQLMNCQFWSNAFCTMNREISFRRASAMQKNCSVGCA